MSALCVDSGEDPWQPAGRHGRPRDLPICTLLGHVVFCEIYPIATLLLQKSQRAEQRKERMLTSGGRQGKLCENRPNGSLWYPPCCQPRSLLAAAVICTRH